MTIKEMVKVMEAYDNGESIEYRSIRDTEGNPIEGDWMPIRVPGWDWINYEFRLASKYWNYEDACTHLGEIIKDKSDNETTIIGTIRTGNHKRDLYINEYPIEEFANKYTFVNGDPCGVKR